MKDGSPKGPKGVLCILFALKTDISKDCAMEMSSS